MQGIPSESAASKASAGARQELEVFASARSPRHTGMGGATIYALFKTFRVPLRVLGMLFPPIEQLSPFYFSFLRLGGVERCGNQPPTPHRGGFGRHSPSRARSASATDRKPTAGRPYCLCALPTPLTVLALCLPHIGVERIYVLLTLARFDSNNTGVIDEQQRQLKGGALVADAAITCSSMSVVSSLIIGLTHLQATLLTVITPTL